MHLSGLDRSKILVIGATIAGLLAAAAAILVVGGSTIPPIDPDDAAQVALGRRVYAAACASCHGADLQGQPNWQERNAEGLLPGPPHDATGHTWHHPTALLYTIISEGPASYAPEGYRSAMPGFRDSLGREEIAAVIAYIVSSWPREIRSRHDAIDARSRE